MDRKTGAPMVKLFEDKMGGREAEVVLDDPRSGAGIVSWFNGIRLPTFHCCTSKKSFRRFSLICLSKGS